MQTVKLAHVADGRLKTPCAHICIFFPTQYWFDTPAFFFFLTSVFFASHILVNNASYLCLINDCCMWPVSEPRS